MSEPFYVTVVLTPVPEKFERAKEVLAKLAEDSKEEPGLLEYQLFEQTNGEGGANVLVIHEKFINSAAHDDHNKSEHYLKTMGAATAECLGTKIDVFHCKPFPG